MRDGTITREIRRLDARIDQLEAEKQALAMMLIEQQRVIDALVLCVGDELGISDARAQGYRQRAMQQRSDAAEKRRRAAAENAAKGVDTSQIAAKRVPIATAGETKQPDGETQAA